MSRLGNQTNPPQAESASTKPRRANESVNPSEPTPSASTFDNTPARCITSGTYAGRAWSVRSSRSWGRVTEGSANDPHPRYAPDRTAHIPPFPIGQRPVARSPPAAFPPAHSPTLQNSASVGPLDRTVRPAGHTWQTVFKTSPGISQNPSREATFTSGRQMRFLLSPQALHRGCRTL